MGRPKKFTREEVLVKALPVFWKHGFADTGLQDLEKATGVNKSGLYSEFESKEELFLACLQHYFETRRRNDILSSEPLGWDNIENFLKAGLAYPGGCKGCFAINSIREFEILPESAHKAMAESLLWIKQSLEKNIRAQPTKTEPAILTDLVSTFFMGICLEQNLKPSKASSVRKIENLMMVLRTL